MEKEAGYDEWFAAKVAQSLADVNSGTAILTDHDQVVDRVWARALVRAKKSPTA